MGHFKCRIGLVWSLILTGVLVVVPRYMEQQSEAGLPTTLAAASVPKIQVVEGTIQKNRTLVATLVDSDIPVGIANNLASLIRPVFDPRKLHSGNVFRLEKEFDGSFRSFEYKIDDESILKVEKDAETYAAKVEKLQLETREATVDGEIRSSLSQALDDYPKSEILVDAFAKIFAWDVDFHTDIQPGDRVRIIVEEQYHDGKFVKYGVIRAAELVNDRKTFQAFRFNDDYYDAKGNAMKRSFLVSPLKFDPRITSGFSRARRHPILGTVRAHTGVDYGAPTGAAVVAVANGTVMSAGWKGDYGQFVQIKHSNGMTSGYGHLSRVGVRAGAAVKQGDTIGAVGQTGLATGPHLHFMITKGGQPVNPTTMKSEPPTPIRADLKPQFLASIAPWQARLDNDTKSAAK